MIGRIQHPVYTAAALAAANPVLLKGEIVYESDTRKRKLGDGVTAWNSLPYLDSASGGGSSNPGRRVVASKLSWPGNTYLEVKVPMRTFTSQPNYTVRGYYYGPSGTFAFSCETCGMLTDGVDYAMAGTVRTSFSSSFIMLACTNYIESDAASNPYGVEAFDQLSLFVRNFTDGMGLFKITEIIEEIF